MRNSHPLDAKRGFWNLMAECRESICVQDVGKEVRLENSWGEVTRSQGQSLSDARANPTKLEWENRSHQPYHTCSFTSRVLDPDESVMWIDDARIRVGGVSFASGCQRWDLWENSTIHCCETIKKRSSSYVVGDRRIGQDRSIVKFVTSLSPVIIFSTSLIH